MKVQSIVTVFVWSAILPGTFVGAQVSLPTPKPLVVVQNVEVPRERREQSFAKLLEAQRYLAAVSRTRSETAATAGAKLAKQALQKAVELNPQLAEAYTMLAEISLSFPPNDIEEAIMFATIATKIDPDNFGSRRILARVFTIKSQIHTPRLDPVSAEKAVQQWKEVARLDPRNAEAWAFLSELYSRTNNDKDRIDSLRKWLAAAVPIDSDFYRTMLGRTGDLSPESAGLKLGKALVSTANYSEAIEILSRSVADDPDNPEAIDLLRQAIESSGKVASASTLELLQQASYANPGNLVLVEMLSDLQVKLGRPEDAVRTLRSTIARVDKNEKGLIANLQVSLGDLFLQTNQNADAIRSYEEALLSFGIEKAAITLDEQREFATRVFEKIIKALKNSGKSSEIKATIERARQLLGKADLFADKQLISYLRETGNKTEALAHVRAVRKNYADEYSLLRTEATLLTELGKVEEGVQLIRALLSAKSSVLSPYYDDFSNYLFISGLFSQAKRNSEALESARLAHGAADSEERRQLASISMATAQHQAGKYAEAEATLRSILKKTPRNPIALNNLGYFLLERNENLSEAVELILRATQIDPTNHSYLDSLGWGYYKLGRFDLAEQYLKEAKRINSGSAAVHEHLGDLYLKQGNNEMARSYWQRALQLSTDTDRSTRIRAKIAQRNSDQ